MKTEFIDKVPLPFGFFDAHVHWRNGKMLKLVAPYTAQYAYGAIVMPNTSPPITTIALAKAYAIDIRQASGRESFTPHLTCYLTDKTNPDELQRGFENKTWVAAKLYPLLGTTGAEGGVSSIRDLTAVFKRMEKIGMPLLIHGELVNEELDPLNMEADFLSHTFPQIIEKYGMPIVLEHITTREAAELVGGDVYDNLYATITPQHLLFDHRDIFQKGKMSDKSFKRGLRPNFFCLPLLKLEAHRDELRKLVSSGCTKVGAGTDSAPHHERTKYQDCGCAGCFTAPIALQMYATAFEKAGALEKLPAFLGLNIPQGVYGVSPKPSKIQLVRRECMVPESVENRNDGVCVEILTGGETLPWDVEVLK